MRIVAFNLLDGVAADPDRLAQVLAWLADQRADVAGLVELNGWEAPGVLAERAAAAGFEHARVLVGPSRYRVGVLARQPIELVAECTAGMHHGLLHVRTAGLHVLVTHWSPNDRERRVSEARLCAARLAAADGPGVLLGDLNSHSPADGALCAAFATPDNRAWAMDFEPHEILLAAGLTDLGAAQAERWSTATALNPTEPRRRLDFVYANAAFCRAYPAARAEVIRTPATHALSDHYPVLCTA